MFDRQVHIMSDDGKRIVRKNPYREHMKMGYPNLLYRNGKCYTENGPYPKDKAPEEWKELYPEYFGVKEVVKEKPVKKAKKVVKKIEFKTPEEMEKEE